MRDYQKVMLYVFPKIDGIIRGINGEIEAQACACFKHESASESAERIVEKILTKDALLILKDAISDILERLTFEERFMLEYKYFRRKKKLEGEFKNFAFDCTERTYFRKQSRLLEKMSSELLKEGLSEEWFYENFSNVGFIMHALKSVAKKGCSVLTDKRFKKKLICKSKTKNAC